MKRLTKTENSGANKIKRYIIAHAKTARARKAGWDALVKWLGDCDERYNKRAGGLGK